MPQGNRETKATAHSQPYPLVLLDHLGKAIEAHHELATPPESEPERDVEPIRLEVEHGE